ncbi:hypothetical protein LSAT2_017688 [Lamellibrachia satsuma]|nr:hypothetical protein LSAT2_017688 [Lamellibrachia satsuma]
MDVAHEASLMLWLVLVFTFGSQVLTTDDNVAVGRPARQTSVVWEGTPDRAVDGDTNGIYENKRCTHTNESNYPWWAVDLETVSLVRSVHIYNRVGENAYRLHDLRVGLVDTWPTKDRASVIAMDTICATLDGPQPDRRVVIQCEENARGRCLATTADDEDTLVKSSTCRLYPSSVSSGLGAQQWFQTVPRSSGYKALRNTTVDTPRQTAEHRGRYITLNRRTPRQIYHARPQNTTADTPRYTAKLHGRCTTPDRGTPQQIHHGIPRNTTADTPRNTAEHHGRYISLAAERTRNTSKRTTITNLGDISPKADTSCYTAEQHGRYTTADRGTPQKIHHARTRNTTVDTSR